MGEGKTVIHVCLLARLQELSGSTHCHLQGVMSDCPLGLSQDSTTWRHSAVLSCKRIAPAGLIDCSHLWWSDEDGQEILT